MGPSGAPNTNLHHKGWSLNFFYKNKYSSFRNMSKWALTHYVRVRLFRRIFSTAAHTLTDNKNQFFKLMIWLSRTLPLLLIFGGILKNVWLLLGTYKCLEKLTFFCWMKLDLLKTFFSAFFHIKHEILFFKNDLEFSIANYISKL